MKVFQRKSQRKGKMCTYQLCNKDLFQWIEYYVINATLSVNPLNLAHYSHSLSLCMYLSAHRTCCRLHTAAMRTALKHISERRTVVSSQFWFSRRRIWLADTEVLSIWNYKYCVKVEKITRNRVVWCECVSVSVSQFQLKIVWLCSTMKKNVFKHIHIVLQLMLTFFDDVYNVEFHWFCCAKILFCEFYWNWFDS